MQPGPACGGAWEITGGDAATAMRPMNSEDSASPVQHDGLPVKGRVWAVLLLGFCCWHAGFLITAIVPRPAGGNGNLVLNFYRLFVSGQQRWNMFDTIPQHHTLTARIEVDHGRSGRAKMGSVMPGFTGYPNPENSRYYNLYYSILLGSEKSPHFVAYLRKMDNLLRAQHGNPIAGHWALVVDVEVTRLLSLSMRDGVLYVPASRFFDPANPRGISP